MEYHLILTSYAAFLPNNTTYPTAANPASASLAHYYDAIASLTSSFTSQNRNITTAGVAFGGRRVWLNFWSLDQPVIGGDNALRWTDLAYVVERWRGFVRRGTVGRWEGVLWAPGEDGGRKVRIEMRVLEQFRRER
ncbi:MAG: hypothetical protein L6R40_008229 [Gallowayella cf. fulva]|nr:MAG: hypothetical protein L6R40_008229 [Xanthomendoza cf. fulva]